MLQDSRAFSGFSINDLDAAKRFYGTILGLDVQDDEIGLRLNITGGNSVFLYQKENHVPATYTVLNFPVINIDQTVDELVAQGVKIEIYDQMAGMQDEKGIARGKTNNFGPDIAWFKDPAGNVLSVLTD